MCIGELRISKDIERFIMSALFFFSNIIFMHDQYTVVSDIHIQNLKYAVVFLLAEKKPKSHINMDRT